MVDNIHFNKISPLLSSTERIKRVDRRPRDDEQAAFKDAPRGKQKKKRKKYSGCRASPSEITAARDGSLPRGPETQQPGKEETDPPGNRGNRIIDIRV
jgi:hypothetical protein